MFTREVILETIHRNRAFTLRADGKNYHVPGADWAHLHPIRELVVLYDERGRIHFVPLAHISELIYDDEDVMH